MGLGRGQSPAQPLQRKLFWVLVILGALVGTAAGIVWTARQDAGWESTGTLFVAFTFPSTEKDPFGGSQFVTQRIDTYAELAGAPEVLQAVADDLGAAGPADVTDNVTVEAVPGTVLIQVTAHDTDRDRSDQLAQSMMTNLNAAAIAVEEGNAENTSPINLVPVQPPVAVPASLLMTAVLAGGAGAVAGGGLGAFAGWLLCRATAGRRSSRPARPAPPHRHGRHRQTTRSGRADDD